MSVTVVGEIGQNHQGSVECAKDLCEMAANPHRHDFREDESYGVDAVKLTKRDLDREGTSGFMSRRYEGRQSFGDTYGEHRAALELSWSGCAEVYDHATALGLDVGITLCAPTLVGELPFTPAFLKVASRDLRNLPLLDALGATELPLILSTGMADVGDLRRGLDVVAAHHDDVSILHCVSAYPTPPDAANLKTIAWLKSSFPQYRIGFSDHTQGIVAPVMAVAMGARIIEKHLTLYRGMRGSDHQGALSSDGLWRMCRDVRMAEKMVGEYGMYVHHSVEPARAKLERSICTADDLEAGTLIGSSNTMLLSPGTGVGWHERDRLFGRRLAEDVDAKTVLSSTMTGEAA